MYPALSLIFITSVSYLQRKLQFSFSDHFFHLGVINGIKKNRHRFVREHPNLIGDRNFVYPQLFHWLLSFLPTKAFTRHYNSINYLFTLATYLSVTALCHILFLKGTGLEEADIGLLGLAFVTTPFLWLPWNAKNLGLSARPPGTALGTAYTLLLLYNTLHFSYTVLCILILLTVVSILLSQFTTQYILFLSIVLSIAFLRIWYLAIPLAAFLLMAAVAFRFTRKYVIGQVTHKYIYSRFLAPEYVLSGRYSIWLDFPLGIYRALRHDWKSGLMHAYTNPFLLVLWAMPFQTWMFLQGAGDTPLQKAIWRFILSGVVILIAFSFRKTRFLGEPERYLEFMIPLPILYFFTLPGFNRMLAAGLVVYSILSIALLLYIEHRSGSKTKKLSQERMDGMYSGFIQAYGDSVSMLSNNWHVTRRFFGTAVKAFTPSFCSLHVGSVPLQTLFKDSFIMLDAGCLEAVMNDHPIDYCIVDQRARGAEQWHRKLQGYGYMGRELGDGYTCYSLQPLQEGLSMATPPKV